MDNESDDGDPSNFRNKIKELKTSICDLAAEVEKTYEKRNKAESTDLDISNKLTDYAKEAIRESKGPLKSDIIFGCLMNGKKKKEILSNIRKDDINKVREQLSQVLSKLETDMELRKKQIRKDDSFIKKLKKMDENLKEELDKNNRSKTVQSTLDTYLTKQAASSKEKFHKEGSSNNKHSQKRNILDPVISLKQQPAKHSKKENSMNDSTKSNRKRNAITKITTGTRKRSKLTSSENSTESLPIVNHSGAFCEQTEPMILAQSDESGSQHTEPMSIDSERSSSQHTELMSVDSEKSSSQHTEPMSVDSERSSSQHTEPMSISSCELSNSQSDAKSSSELSETASERSTSEKDDSSENEETIVENHFNLRGKPFR